MEAVITGLIVLIVIAIILAVVGWILGMILDALTVPALIKKLVFAILALIGLVFVVRFLLTLLSLGHGM